MICGRLFGVDYAPKVVLQLPIADKQALGPFVEACLRSGVILVAIAGQGADTVEEEIDWLVIGDGSDPARFLATTAHPDKRLEEVVAFAEAWATERDPEVQLVRL